MWWLGVGGLAEGLPDLKGPVSGPLSVAMHTAPLARGLAGLGACICRLNIFPEPEFGPGGAWPSMAASPGCPSPCPSWLRAWERLQPPPAALSLGTDPLHSLPCTPSCEASWNPGTLEVSGPDRVAWVVLSVLFFFWAVQGGGAGRGADNWASSSQGWRQPLAPRVEV